MPHQWPTERERQEALALADYAIRQRDKGRNEIPVAEMMVAQEAIKAAMDTFGPANILNSEAK